MSKNQPEIKFVSKGWGYEKWIVNKKEYCGKILHIVKGKRCSLHYHRKKDEVFYVESGKVHLFYSDDLERLKEFSKHPPSGRTSKDFVDSVVLHPGDNFYIPPGRVHQIIAIQDTKIFEFSTFHEDSDSYRLIPGD